VEVVYGHPEKIITRLIALRNENSGRVEEVCDRDAAEQRGHCTKKALCEYKSLSFSSTVVNVIYRSCLVVGKKP
jgi:hypothetical protein